MLDFISNQIGPTANTRQDGATGRPTRFQCASEEQTLAFFLKFTVEERVARFGAVTSDAAIRSWRNDLDRSHYAAVSMEQAHLIIGLVELFGSKLTGWRRPELALSIHGLSDKSNVRLHLLEIGLGAARERGIRDVYVAFNSAESCMIAIVRRYGGTLDHQSGTAVIPCDFATREVNACRPVVEVGAHVSNWEAGRR
jgi:hypothetical protein